MVFYWPYRCVRVSVSSVVFLLFLRKFLATLLLCWIDTSGRRDENQPYDSCFSKNRMRNCFEAFHPLSTGTFCRRRRLVVVIFHRSGATHQRRCALPLYAYSNLPRMFSLESSTYKLSFWYVFDRGWEGGSVEGRPNFPRLFYDYSHVKCLHRYGIDFRRLPVQLLFRRNFNYEIKGENSEV